MALLAGVLALGGLGYWIGVVAPARDAAAWDTAVAQNTVAAFERYVAEQPSGRHVEEARQRRDVLTRQAQAGPRPSGGVSLSEAAPTAQPASASPPVAPAAAPTPIGPSVGPRIGSINGERGEDGDNQAAPAASAEPKPASITPAPSPPSTRPQPPAPPAFRARATLPPPIPDGEIARVAEAAPTAKWRLAIGVFAGDKVTGFTEQPADFVAEHDKLSGGKIELTTLTGDAALPRGELLQRLRSERDLLAWHAPLPESNRHLEFTILSGAVPFGLEPSDHVRWLRAEGARLLEQAYIDTGTPMRVIPCGIAGGVGAWFKKEVRSPADFKGLKVRGGHLIVRSLRRLEAEVVNLPSNRELSAAFTSNRLDANFGVTPLTGLFLAQPRVATVYHYPGVHNPAYLFELVVGPETWASMAEPQRRLLDDACRRNLDRWAQFFPSVQNDVLTRIRAQRITVRPFTGPVREALKKAVDETLAEEAAKSARFKEILESYNRFRR